MAIIRKSLKDLKASPPVINWAKIDATTEQEIERMVPEDGDDQATSSGEVAPSVKTLRLRQEMTQEQFAAALRIPVNTLRNWEQGRVAPDPAARALLTVLAKNPKAVLDALADAPRS
jgi:putative transcriptional regulator